MLFSTFSLFPTMGLISTFSLLRFSLSTMGIFDVQSFGVSSFHMMSFYVQSENRLLTD